MRVLGVVLAWFGAVCSQRAHGCRGPASQQADIQMQLAVYSQRVILRDVGSVGTCLSLQPNISASFRLHGQRRPRVGLL
ncbi:hypothetical protein XENTR_v10020237 [Xenopus tropicalis]|nr:hypothetical protein XENTR_v10020237 [Xenopus tropicalis]